MKKDKKNMNYPEDFKLGNGDREFADANNKGLVVHYSDEAVKHVNGTKMVLKNIMVLLMSILSLPLVGLLLQNLSLILMLTAGGMVQNYLIHTNKSQSSGIQRWVTSLFLKKTKENEKLIL